ncbi:MAG TPA: c-type cytochrome [Vicinamibacterales bacterium]|nr:c-type cytochrome [Vicinamibacterales bacterium]
MRLAALLLIVGCIATTASAAPDPATTFARNCSSCHTFGSGIKVGPDLKGVTDRHDRKWLTAWIASSDRLIQSGDPQAQTLFTKFKKQRMPDQRLAPEEIGVLLDYLAAGGPARAAQRSERAIESATPEDIEAGSALFSGRRPFARGTAACASCHRVGADDTAGGTLGPDLSRAYIRLRDRSVGTLISRGCFPRSPDASASSDPTEQETFAVKAFLRKTAMERR